MFASFKDTFIPYASPCQLELVSVWDKSHMFTWLPVMVQNAQISSLNVWCNVWGHGYDGEYTEPQ